MSNGVMAQPEVGRKVSYQELLETVSFLSNENRILNQEISQLKDVVSQLQQQKIDSGTMSSNSQSRGKKPSGRPTKEITLSSFRNALKDDFKPKTELVINWIKKQITKLNNDPDYCSALMGNRRLMAPLYVAIEANVFTPKDANDARPVLEGSPLERFFGLPGGSYSKNSKHGSFRPGEIQELTGSFNQEVLN